MNDHLTQNMKANILATVFWACTGIHTIGESAKDTIQIGH